jgi:hypothetical protein
MLPILIISNGKEKACEFAKDRGWNKGSWKYINDVRKLRAFKGFVLVLAYDYEKVRNIDKVFSICEKYDIGIIDESYEVLRTKGELGVLSVANSAMVRMKKQYTFGNEFSEMVDRCLELIGNTVKNWKYDSVLANDVANNKWIVYKINSWEKLLVNSETQDSWTMTVLVQIAMTTVLDLFESLHDIVKANMVSSIFDELQKMGNFLDSKGNQVSTYRYADYLVCELYSTLKLEY